MGGQKIQAGLARQETAQAADGVFHATLLPGGMGVAEEGLQTQGMELVVMGEFSAVIKGNGAAPLGRKGSQELGQGCGDGSCSLVKEGNSQEETGVPLVDSQQGMASVAKEHQVGLPVTGNRPVQSFHRTVQGLFILRIQG